MKRTFEYIREKYTDVNGYLDYIGFGEKEREGLRRALTFKALQLGSPQSQLQTKRKTSDGATPRNGSPARSDKSDSRSTSPERSRPPHRTHDRSRNASSGSTSSDTDSGYSSGSSAWSPDSREKPLLGRSLGVPIGARRAKRSGSHGRSGSETPDLKYLIANPRAGVEYLGSALGLLPLSEDKHHRRSSSDDANNREAVRDDGFLPPPLPPKQSKSPLATTSYVDNSPPEHEAANGNVSHHEATNGTVSHHETASDDTPPPLPPKPWKANGTTSPPIFNPSPSPLSTSPDSLSSSHPDN
jgi:hypothetical protein